MSHIDNKKFKKYKEIFEGLEKLDPFEAERQKMLTDILFADSEKEIKQTRRIIAFLYLKMAWLANIPLEMAYERYDWVQTDNTDYMLRGDIVQIAPKREVCIFLTPRKRISECKMIYREMAANALELVRESFHLPSDSLSFVSNGV